VTRTEDGRSQGIRYSTLWWPAPVWFVSLSDRQDTAMLSRKFVNCRVCSVAWSQLTHWSTILTIIIGLPLRSIEYNGFAYWRQLWPPRQLDRLGKHAKSMCEVYTNNMSIPIAVPSSECEHALRDDVNVTTIRGAYSIVLSCPARNTAAWTHSATVYVTRLASRLSQPNEQQCCQTRISVCHQQLVSPNTEFRVWFILRLSQHDDGR